MDGCIQSWCPAAGRIHPRTAGSSFRRPQPRDRFARHQLTPQRPAATDHIDRAVARNLACGTDELIPRIERIRMIGAAALDLAFVAEEALDACVMMSNKPWENRRGNNLGPRSRSARQRRPGQTRTRSNPPARSANGGYPNGQRWAPEKIWGSGPRLTCSAPDNIACGPLRQAAAS
jgi:hypothetical protein